MSREIQNTNFNLPPKLLKRKLEFLMLIGSLVLLFVSMHVVRRAHDLSSMAAGNPSIYKVFVSSTLYNGDLGGLSGADAKCQSLAASAGLSGTYKAWLSDSNTNAKDRIPDNASYYLVDGVTKVADNKADLIDGNIDHEINKDELGNAQSWQTWTGTKSDGSKDTTHCNNWTAVSGYSAKDGKPIYNDYRWTQHGSSSCNNGHALYCFQTSTLSPCPPVLKAPADGAIVASPPTVEWNSCFDAVKYRINLKGGIINWTSLPLSGNSYPLSSFNYQPGNSYTWKVQACFDSNCGNVSAWSTPFTFWYQFQLSITPTLTPILTLTLTPTPSRTPTPSVIRMPTPSATLTPTPPSSENNYRIDIGQTDSLTIHIGAGPITPPGDIPQIRFKAKLAHTQNNPEMYFKLRVKDDLAFIGNPNSKPTCEDPGAGGKDFYVPVRADSGGVYMPVSSVSNVPSPPGGAVIAQVVDGWVILEGISAGKYYSFTLKAQKTRATKTSEHVILNIGHPPEQDFDWTNNLLEPGDLPDPNNGDKQDCTVNSIDLSLVESRISNTDPVSLRIADVNYDGVVNGNDVSKVVNTLSNKPDDDL